MKTISTLRVNLIWITIFSIAMGYLECAVVVYLRAIYYPAGFEFPLTTLSIDHAITEIGREAATLIMLLGMGILSAKDKWDRFAVFLYSFAIWDIFYYVFLKVLLGWPDSFMTWDILFLIPTVWTGPVLAPILSSATMILLTLAILHRKDISRKVYDRNALIILISGAAIQFIAYLGDYIVYARNEGMLRYLFSFSESDIFSSYIPVQFPWLIFIIGEALILFSVLLMYRKESNNINGH